MVKHTSPTPHEPSDDEPAGDQSVEPVNSSRPPLDGNDPADVPVTHEVTLQDGESVSFSTPIDGTTHVVVNLVQPPKPTGFFGSCLQGCGCLFVIGIIIAFISAAFR